MDYLILVLVIYLAGVLAGYIVLTLDTCEDLWYSLHMLKIDLDDVKLLSLSWILFFIILEKWYLEIDNSFKELR